MVNYIFAHRPNHNPQSSCHHQVHLIIITIIIVGTMRTIHRGWLKVGSVARPRSIIMMAYSNRSPIIVIIITIFAITIASIITNTNAGTHYFSTEIGIEYCGSLMRPDGN